MWDEAGFARRERFCLFWGIYKRLLHGRLADWEAFERALAQLASAGGWVFAYEVKVSFRVLSVVIIIVIYIVIYVINGIVIKITVFLLIVNNIIIITIFNVDFVWFFIIIFFFDIVKNFIFSVVIINSSCNFHY